MSRETNFQVQARQVVGTLEDQHKYDLPTLRRLGVFAEPTNNFVAPVSPATTGAAQLASALAEAKPEVMNVLTGLKKDADEDSAELRKAEAIRSGDLSYDEELAKASNYDRAGAESFLKTRGFIRGETLDKKFNQDWEQVDKTGKDANGNPTFKPADWIGNWWKENTAGIDNPHVVAGLNKVMGTTLQKAMASWGDQHLKDIVDEKQYQNEQLLKGDLDAHQDYSGEHYNQRVLDVGGNSRAMSQAAISLMEKSVKNGDVETVDKLLRLKAWQSPDGVHVFGKAFGNDLELISSAATRKGIIYESKKKAEAAVIKQKVEGELTDITLLGLSGKSDEAIEQLDNLLKTNKGLGHEEIIKTRNMLLGAFKKEETREMKLAYTDMFVGVDTGKLGRNAVQQAITDQKISVEQGVSLLARIKSNQDQARQEGKQDAALKRQELQMAKEVAHRSVFSLNKEDLETIGREQAIDFKQDLGLMELDFLKSYEVVWKDPEKSRKLIAEFQAKVKGRYTDAVNQVIVSDKNYTPKYKTKAEVQAAHSAGKITLQEAQKNIEYLKRDYKGTK
jgi:hypothetical protein